MDGAFTPRHQGVRQYQDDRGELRRTDGYRCKDSRRPRHSHDRQSRAWSSVWSSSSATRPRFAARATSIRARSLLSRYGSFNPTLAMTAASIRAPVPVEGVVMRLLAEWTAADKLIAAAVALREQAGARAN